MSSVAGAATAEASARQESHQPGERPLGGMAFAQHAGVRPDPRANVAEVVANPPEWPPEGFHRPVYIALINTCILVTSSFTVHWATTSIKRGNRTGLQAGLVLTFLLGLTFLLTQVVEYLNVGFNTGDGAFASVFFGLTGLHGAHVFIGLTLLGMVIVRGCRGHFTPEHHHGVELPGIYWHFVDVMWIVVYSVVYLI